MSSTKVYHKRYFIHIVHLFSAAFPLTVGYVAEYYADIWPCTLCMIQRFCFMWAAVTSMAGIIWRKNFFVVLASLFFLLCATVAFYNTALERSWVLGKTIVCHGHKNGLFDKLFNKYNVPCNVPAVKILGISLAEVNFVYCIFILIVTFFLLKIQKRQDKKGSRRWP